MQICLISWNMCLVFRFAHTEISPLCSLICMTVDMVWGKIAMYIDLSFAINWFDLCFSLADASMILLLSI